MNEMRLMGRWSWLIALAVLLAGCGTPRSSGDLDRLGKVSIQLQFREKDKIRLEKPAWVYDDGVEVGSCSSAPGEVVAELTKGSHKITIEIPWAWQFSHGGRQRAIAFKGEQIVEISGGKTQVLIFDLENLQKKPLD